MDELKLLRDWDAGAGEPREAARQAARERLLEAARAAAPAANHAPAAVPRRARLRLVARPVRGPGGVRGPGPGGTPAAGGMSRRTAVRTLVAAGATAAAVGTPLTLLAGDGATGPAADGAGVLRRAARLERERERLRAPLEPRRGQYVYTRVFFREIADDTGKAVTYASECWIAADSSRRSWLSRGRGGSWRQQEEAGAIWPPADWRTVAGIPTEPEALLTFLSSPYPGGGPRRILPADFGDDEWQQSFFYLSGLLNWIPVLPEGLLPAVFAALAEFPDLLVADGAEDAHGRDALALTCRDTDDSPTYLLFAADTHEYLGLRTRRSSDPNESRTFTKLSYLDAYDVVDDVRKRP
ncbi:hypothetical protein O7599_30650 [Streptomyces sp. WMMC500]|uniref:hypothetical protein n=1 Tax=Streptomyces sp. WMMC500 TaxID=3015154 RepID=UPI00248B0A86|nr:hypothetical protein [Streptomyces sp. WMMC500]WBB59867.1 hypothetical protein O7599_30650 [Streptomyces sp. WMMC500]